MNPENIKEISKKAIYSIDQYKGAKKWCFAIVLNRACDNYEGNPHLFSESLLEFEKTNRKDWFDEETRELIEKADTEIQPNPNLKPNTTANRKLKDIRNYFSHHYHKNECLYFKNDDPIRCIMEAAYEKAKIYIKGKQIEQSDIPLPELFESSGCITPAGILLLASFFVERGILHRLMGNIGGFKDNRGEYGLTHDIFTTYCLKGSYSIQAQDHDAVMFRDILGYLSRVPTESFQRIKQPKIRKEGQLSERKTDKFIKFALNYLEHYGLKDLEGCKACFARSKIVREQEDVESIDDKEYKPHENKKKVEIHFDQSKEYPFYINRNNVILKIQKKDGHYNIVRMGVYELKYLVLLSLSGKARDSVETIDQYIQGLRDQLPSYIEKKNEKEIQEYINFLPGFIRSHLGLLNTDDDKKLKARIAYVKAKWLDKKEKSKELELHRKGRDILRYINERCDRELNRNVYNRILELLVGKDLAGFYRELEELKRTRRIDKNIVQNLSGQKTINALHEKVCDLVLKEIESLDTENLKKYLGLIPKEEKEVTFKEKVNRILDQPVIYKGCRFHFT